MLVVVSTFDAPVSHIISCKRAIVGLPITLFFARWKSASVSVTKRFGLRILILFACCWAP